MPRVRLIPLLVLVAVTVLVATAGGSPQPFSEVAVAAKKKPEPDKPERTDLASSKDLWATINLCDTTEEPDTIGIRGSMPGLGNRDSKLQMRFQVQYKARATGDWTNAGADADSGWQTVGRTIRQVLESGQNFTFAPPTDGGSHQLRGAVRYRWLRANKTRAFQRRFTEPGHASTAGADPENYSAATCELS